MPTARPSHPDRLAETLANLPAAHAARPTDGTAPPGDGAHDCRIDLKCMLWQALRAAQRSDEARVHLQRLPRERHPDLWAGTVRDGAALGFLAHLHEVVSLAPAAPDDGGAWPEHPDPGAQLLTDRKLRRKQDLLVKSGGPRVRFTRKGGVLFVDRAHDLHSENCLWFEACRDIGTLDGFVGAEGERARLYSAQFLQPRYYLAAKARTELQLAGRLGRGPIGWPITVTLRGDDDRQTLELFVELPHAGSDSQSGWRLRMRTLGLPATHVHHHCTPVRELVDNDHGGFVADTLVRACEHLLVDGTQVAVPDAAAPRRVRHRFTLGADMPR